jgi:hypothetical protein
VSYMTKLVAAIVGLPLMALVTSWELFLFAVMRDPSGLSTEGGRSHLLLAAIAGITICVAGALMFHSFLCQCRIGDKLLASSQKEIRGPCLSSRPGRFQHRAGITRPAPGSIRKSKIEI